MDSGGRRNGQKSKKQLSIHERDIWTLTIGIEKPWQSSMREKAWRSMFRIRVMRLRTLKGWGAGGGGGPRL